jgi:hypothetical protein
LLSKLGDVEFLIADTSEEAIRRLAILVEKRHTLSWMAQAEQTFSLFQPIIDAAKSFSNGVGNFFRTIMFYKNFHFYSSGPNKDNNTMHTMGVDSDSIMEIPVAPTCNVTVSEKADL